MTFFMKLFAMIMVIWMPLSNLFYKEPDKSSIVYKTFDSNEKAEQKMTEYEFGEYDIVVAPGGNDHNSGSETSPLETIEGAKKLAIERRMKTQDKITVWIKGGEYYFDKAAEFGKGDAENVSYIAMPGEKVVFSGSMKLTGWKSDTANGQPCFSADVPVGTQFNQVFKNGTTVPQTRYPETGYFYIDNEDHEGSKFTEENTPWSLTHGDLEFTPAKNQKIKNFTNPQNVTVRVLHLWVDDFSKLKGYDSQRNRILLENPMSASILEDNKYYFENVYEAFDKPGEWYLDSANGKVYYIPEDGETKDNLDISVAVTDRLINMSNCKNIYFEGITFQNTDSTYPEIEPGSWLSSSGLRFPQAEYDCGGSIEITKSTGIDFKYCKFINLGLCGIKFNRYCKNCSVSGCDFKNIGASGVYIHGFNTDVEENITENISVTDNIIDGYGRYFYSAIGVLLTNARNCKIEHNEICNGYYTAVSVGWLWGYAYSVTNNNSISYNHIYNIGQGWLSDMGGIYTLGRQKGTVLRGNVIHNVAADPGEGGYGGWGIYFDEGSQFILAEKNLVYDCGSHSFHQHYGENNVLKNNIFALSDEGQVISNFAYGKNQIGYADPENHNEFTLEGNIILSNDTPSYAYLQRHVYKDSKNLVWDLTNHENVFCMDNNDYENKLRRVYSKDVGKYGLWNDVVIADPVFKDPLNFDFSLPENSEVLKSIGFEIWDYSLAGTTTKR